MPIPMIECTGCGRNFTLPGYARHVHTTTHLPCITVYEEEVNRVEASLQEPRENEDNEAFDEWDVGNSDESNAELDSDDIDVTGEPQALPYQPDEEIPTEPEVQAPPELSVDEDWVIEQFALHSAGAPLTATDNAGNRSNMGAGGTYAPFVSRIDWELARWAKSETISSNALTRLFSINGVSVFLVCHI